MPRLHLNDKFYLTVSGVAWFVDLSMEQTINNNDYLKECMAVSKPNTNCIICELLRMFSVSNNMIINGKHSGMLQSSWCRCAQYYFYV
jgi:hypothetical protein